MTTIELFWFLLKNIIFHPNCANKTVGTVEGTKAPYLAEINCAIRIKNVEHAEELGLVNTCLAEGDEDYFKNVIILEV